MKVNEDNMTADLEKLAQVPSNAKENFGVRLLLDGLPINEIEENGWALPAKDGKDRIFSEQDWHMLESTYEVALRHYSVPEGLRFAPFMREAEISNDPITRLSLAAAKAVVNHAKNQGITLIKGKNE